MMGQSNTINYRLGDTNYKLEVLRKSIQVDLTDEITQAVINLPTGALIVPEQGNIIGMVTKKADNEIIIYLFYRYPDSEVYIYEHIVKTK